MTTVVRHRLLGNRDHPEMRPLVATLAGDPFVALDGESGETEGPLLGPEASADPDLVVVLLSHPDEFSAVEVAELRAAHPLARWLVACSTWCASLGRNRDVWPRASLVPAAWAVERLAAERAVITEGRPPLPATASRDEAWAHDHTVDEAAGPNDELIETIPVGVTSPDAELAAVWHTALSEAGARVVRDSVTIAPDEAPRRAVFEGAEVIVFDGDPWPQRRPLLRNLAARFRGGIVVPMTMPSPPPPAELADGRIRVVPKLAPATTLMAAVAAVHAAAALAAGTETATDYSG